MIIIIALKRNICFNHKVDVNLRCEYLYLIANNIKHESMLLTFIDRKGFPRFLLYAAPISAYLIASLLMKSSKQPELDAWEIVCLDLYMLLCIVIYARISKVLLSRKGWYWGLVLMVFAFLLTSAMVYYLIYDPSRPFVLPTYHEHHSFDLREFLEASLSGFVLAFSVGLIYSLFRQLKVLNRRLDALARKGLTGLEPHPDVAALNPSRFLFFKDLNSGQEISIKSDRIRYVQVMKNYCHIEAVDGLYRVRDRLKSIFSELGDRHFMQVERSFVVNKSLIGYIRDNQLYLKDDDLHGIRIGPKYEQSLKNFLQQNS